MLLFRRNATSGRKVYLLPLQSRDIVKYQHKFPDGHIINIQECIQEIETCNNVPELLEQIYQSSHKS